MLAAITVYMYVLLTTRPVLGADLTCLQVFRLRMVRTLPWDKAPNSQLSTRSVYLMFEAYPIVFSVGHGFSAGITGLMFLGVFLGGVLSTIVYLVYFNPRYKKVHKRYKPEPTPPEVRIEFCLMAAPLLVIAFFVFGWTSYPTLSWVGPCIGGGILGAAVLAIFVSLFNYVSTLARVTSYGN